MQQFLSLIVRSPIIVSSLQERAAAEGFMAGVRQAYPEVAVSVRTTQLAHRLLARKAAFVGELGRSGALFNQLLPLLQARTGSRSLHVRPCPAVQHRAEALQHAGMQAASA